MVILLIEDNDGDARLVVEGLKSAKITNTLVRVHDGSEALDYLYSRGAYTDVLRPDLIILDLNMPKIDGREFLKRIKRDEELTNIPLVVLTTSQDEVDISQSYENLANCFISKPLDFTKFVEIVQSIEHFWFRVAHLPENRS